LIDWSRSVTYVDHEITKWPLLVKINIARLWVALIHHPVETLFTAHQLVSCGHYDLVDIRA
jgi:hypothetical protein